MPKRLSCDDNQPKKLCSADRSKSMRRIPPRPLPPMPRPRPLPPRPQPRVPLPQPRLPPLPSPRPLPPQPQPSPRAPLPEPLPEVKKEYVSVELYTAYLGKVSVVCVDLGGGKVALEAEVAGLDGKPILVKCVDAVASRINADNPQPLSQLAKMKATVIDVAENKRAWDDTRNGEKKRAVPRCGKSLGQPDTLKNLVLLDAVDIHFQTQNYVQFLHETLGINSVEVPPVDGRSVLVSIHNVSGLDNAFFTGECMVYGNGDRMFKPLGCADVAGHELGHSFSKQDYVGHAGALNESFADVMGVSFEFWLYKKYNDDANKSNDILGTSDWTIGEDIGSAIGFLRNMADPTQAEQPQPKMYRGQFWANPNARDDEGGVHTNSGVSNYCFYLCAQHMSLLDALHLFFDCFRSLSKRATFIEFRDNLVRCCGGDATMLDVVRGALDAVGLTKDAVSDWK